MGIDKKNVRTVIHESVPESIEAYLQESGRLGRDGLNSEAYLLWNEEDEKRLNARKKEQTLEPNAKRALERTEQLLLYAKNTSTCRRKALLAMLDFEIESCSGCDVCNKRVQSEDPSEKVILHFIKKNPNRYSIHELSLMISSCESAERARSDYAKKRIEVTGSWTQRQAEEALKSLLVQKKIAHGSFLFAKESIHLTKAHACLQKDQSSSRISSSKTALRGRFSSALVSSSEIPSTS